MKHWGLKMKKLKDLLKESFVWERQFGEKLPTLDSIQKKHDEGKLTEGGAWTTSQQKSVDKIDNQFKKLLAKKGIEPYSYEASQLWKSAGFNKKMRVIFGKDESIGEGKLTEKEDKGESTWTVVYKGLLAGFKKAKDKRLEVVAQAVGFLIKTQFGSGAKNDFIKAFKKSL